MLVAIFTIPTAPSSLCPFFKTHSILSRSNIMEQPLSQSPLFSLAHHHLQNSSSRIHPVTSHLPMSGSIDPLQPQTTALSSYSPFSASSFSSSPKFVPSSRISATFLDNSSPTTRPQSISSLSHLPSSPLLSNVHPLPPTSHLEQHHEASLHSDMYDLSEQTNFIRILPRSSATTGIYKKRCETCSATHDGSFGAGRFCSSRCARTVGGLAHRKKRMMERDAKQRLSTEYRSKIFKRPSSERGLSISESAICQLQNDIQESIPCAISAVPSRTVITINSLLNPTESS